MAKKRIRIVGKVGGKPRVYSSDPIEEEDAERLLRDEVLPKVGKSAGIMLPGLLVLNGKDIVSAELSSSAGRTARGKRRPR